MIFKRPLKNRFQFSIFFFYLFVVLLFSFPFRIYSEELPEFKVDVHELQSGMKVYLKEDHSSPLVVFALIVGVGSRTEGELLGTGVSHLLEHLVFGGSDQTGSSKITESIEVYGGQINAYTTADFTLYYISIPKEWANAGLKALSDSLLNPSLDSKSIEKEKQIILHEIQMGKDEPFEVLQKFFWQTAYRIHPYRMRIIGYRDLLQDLKSEDLVSYFRKMYVPENMALTVVGDFNSRKILNNIEEQFRFLKRQPFSQPVVPQEPNQTGMRKAVFEEDTQLARLMMGFKIPGFGNSNTVPLDVLSVILGDGTQSKLYRRLQEEQGITREITASTSSLLDSGMFLIGAIMPAGEIENVENEISALIESVRKDGVSVEELTRAKKRILNDFYAQLQSFDRQAFWISVFSFLSGKSDYVTDYLKRVEQVSREDILEVARHYLSPDEQTVCVQTPFQKKSDQKESLESKKNYPWVEERFLNGTKILFLEDHSVPLVSINAVFEGGIIAENEKNNGIFQLLTQIAIRGTSSKNAGEILGSIEAVGGDLSGFVDLDLFGFSLDIPKSSLEKALGVLFEILNKASFPEREIQKQKEQSLSAIRQIQDSPLLWGFDRLKRTLYSDHPYRFLIYGNPDSIKRISRDDLLNFYHRFVRSDRLVLSIVGDISREEILNLLKENFGEWSSRGEKDTIVRKAVEPKEVLRIHEFRDQEQSIIMLGFLGARFQDHDRYALDLLTEFFSGFGSPLFKKIREELGAAYYVGAVSLFGLDPGMFIIYSGTTPENESKVLKVIEKTLEELREGRLSEKDITRAQNQWIGKRVRDLQTFGAKSLDAAENKFYIGGIRTWEEIESRIKAIRKKDLIEVAQKYLSEKNRIVLIVSPKKEKKDRKE